MRSENIKSIFSFFCKLIQFVFIITKWRYSGRKMYSSLCLYVFSIFCI